MPRSFALVQLVLAVLVVGALYVGLRTMTNRAAHALNSVPTSMTISCPECFR